MSKDAVNVRYNESWDNEIVLSGPTEVSVSP